MSKLNVLRYRIGISLQVTLLTSVFLGHSACLVEAHHTEPPDGAFEEANSPAGETPPRAHELADGCVELQQADPKPPCASGIIVDEKKPSQPPRSEPPTGAQGVIPEEQQPPQPPRGA